MTKLGNARYELIVAHALCQSCARLPLGHDMGDAWTSASSTILIFNQVVGADDSLGRRKNYGLKERPNIDRLFGHLGWL
jgi:hypothetical protein